MIVSRHNTLWFLQVVVVFTLGLIFVMPAAAEDIWEQYTQSTIDGMTSETVSTVPADRTRTTIGIGEEVVCSIDSGTWEDWDCKRIENGIEVAEDTIGDRVWGCTAGGTVNPSGVTSSDSTTLTADKSPHAAVVVLVHVYDSETKYDDDYIQKTKSFAVIEPSSTTWSKNWDCPEWTDWSSGVKFLGAKTFFTCTINPTTVSFYRVQIQENFDEGETDTWPDNTTTWEGPTGIIGPVIPTEDNEIGDDQVTGLYPCSYLYTGSEWQDFSPSFSIPVEYLNESSNPVEFDRPTATRNYYHSDKTSKVGAGGQSGDAQGPWQAP